MHLNVLQITQKEKMLLLFIKDVTEKKSVTELLYYRLAMEELVTNISTYFLTLTSEEVETGINCALEAIGESIGVDRCFIDLYSDDLTGVEQTYEWCADGIKPRSKNSREVCFDYFPCSLEKNKFFEPVRIHHKKTSKEIKLDEEEVWLAYDNKTFLAIPMVVSKKLRGLFGFSLEREERIWSREDIRLLKMVGEVFVNSFKRREAEQKFEVTREYAENIVNTIREPLLVIDEDMRIISASSSFYRTFKVEPEDTEGQILYELGNGQWDIPELRRLLENILPRKTTIEDFNVEHDFLTIGKRTMLVNARKIYSDTDKRHLILMAIEDITEKKKTEQEKEKLLRELQISLEKIRTLKGMLPVCASCKKIRDDKGEWHQFESYISKHTEADFTHGLCPECLNNLYPEFSPQ